MLIALLWAALLGLVAGGLASISIKTRPYAGYAGLVVALIAFLAQVTAL